LLGVIRNIRVRTSNYASRLSSLSKHNRRRGVSMRRLISELKSHPHQYLIPPMSEEDYHNLLEDIKRNGILQPIDITYNNVILDGHHRVKAAKEVGIKEIEVRIPELLDIDEDEYLISVALNRRHLTEGQKAVLANNYSKILSKKFNENKNSDRARDEIGRFLPILETVSKNGDEKEENVARKIASERWKVSEWKVRIAHEIEKTAPKVYEKLGSGDLQIHEAKIIAQLPEDKREIALEKKLETKKDIRSIVREINNAEKNQNVKPIPEGKFSIIYANPPWEYEHPISLSREIENHYPTMELEKIKETKVPADDNAMLFLWTPAPLIEHGLEVMKAWGFSYRTSMVWVKDKIGMGNYVRMKHELLLIGTKGEGIGMPLPENKPESVIFAERTEHSKKPDIFYEIIEKMYPKHSKIELFARNKKDGWEAWGNEMHYQDLATVKIPREKNGVVLYE
jgi:N6-adenosine-specific RNA methylase IME4/ParB-like chromosome segregation protein Spo0J